MEDLVRRLAAVHMWRDASESVLSDLAASTRTQTFDVGEQVVVEGDPATRFGVVLEGRVRVYHLGTDGRRFAFEDLEAFEPFAVAAALSGGRYPASVEAGTRVTVAWFEREVVYTALEREPRLARALIGDLARQVANLTGVAQTLALDVPARLAGFLFQRALSVGRPSERGLFVELGMSKAELAEALGTVPATLSRALSRLRDEGVIDVDGRTIRIHNVGALARLSSGYSED